MRDEPMATHPRERADKVDLGSISIPRHHANVLDAISQSRRIFRSALVCELIKKFVDEIDHQHMLYERLTRGNPADSDD